MEYQDNKRRIQQVFRELNLDLPIPNIYEDNNGAIQLIQHPAHHERTKHIDIRFHFIRNVLQEGKLKIQRVDTKSQLADIFTKPLAAPTFETLKQMIVT